MADSFENTGLSPVLCAMAAQAGLTEPTPIQAAAIPAILQGRDILATAPTGTGKTAAYALPLIQTLLETRKARMVLVLLPTRDLVLQTAKVFLHCMGAATRRGKTTSQPLVPVVPIIGGTDRTEQTQALVEATSDLTRPCTQILIATPGRLLDLVLAGQCSLDDCASLVLDEGDRLLSAEFLDETSALLDHLPKPRQTLVFSATRPDEQANLLASLLYKPQEITVEREPLKRGPIRQGALFMEDTQKVAFLKTFFSRAPKTRSIVFVRTKAEADLLASTLRKAGFAAAPLHADLTQERRTSTLASFGAGRLFILVATDVAARGLDITAVAQVINYDVPEQPETYLHRIGRTGRGGQKGSALTLCAATERKRLRQVEVGAGVKLRILSPEQALPTEQETQKNRRAR
ncbi:DEAD/DEAH box helicase [Acetobacter peroxydans]|jgi:ATP-dependent RNA helicase RhlE|uniref:DEAD/DEAH box helicase n=1 Tax=Acetobacter peroxydans TaxID=104098 RepID=UPI002354C124|nr:DEAD/DEAH box helicase [Acetobacter peroxydans]MCH4144354.1 DEAD/DEAH box helicase [Acetobacter peroxydans]MCI1394778.1 DEAD/DEAH box helicase [Acetobacter peroxydans]MCI1411870.1 DEAD/DEAH box helicase [Acetobacter peroxydans]MCI1567266.1 DEAD/DEAH box helicase [Acetobacter peroxydans]MCI1619046.1 DEAD/DEAH box helicase [Acetobacter peroxydans]